MYKSFYDISWKVSEEGYRADSALSYSTLSRFHREGFNGLKHLFDRIETPSLTFGSAVDSIITGGQEEFDRKFTVAEFPSVRDSVVTVVKALFKDFHETVNDLREIPDDTVIKYASLSGFQNNWKPETRARVIKEEGHEYYSLLYISKDKTILSTDVYRDVCNTVDALKGSPSTREYFSPDNPWNGIQKFYQLKFKTALHGIMYRCMADLIIVDHNSKTVYPVDLKTSSKPEWDFFKSFVDWNYQIQARLYWRIIRRVMDSDPVFCDYALEDYRFVVVNKTTLKPLVWVFKDTSNIGTLIYGSARQILFSDPENIGRELSMYLSKEHNVPLNITETGINNLNIWLNTL